MPLFYALEYLCSMPKEYHHYECESQFYGTLEKIRSLELFAKADKAEI